MPAEAYYCWLYSDVALTAGDNFSHIRHHDTLLLLEDYTCLEITFRG